MNVVRISDKLVQHRSIPAGQLMTSFSPFIRKTSPEIRKALANALEISMPSDVNWADPGLSFAKVMIAAVESQEEPGRAKSTFALERMSVMADDVGDIAMESVWNGQSECPELAGAQDRAIWMFINRNDIFQHAEEVRFIDSRRQTSCWSGNPPILSGVQS